MAILLHPSSIGKIMIEPKNKGDILSVGAKTFLKGLAREMMYDFRQEIDVKVLRKGNMCEGHSIQLLNRVYFKNYKKHEGRIETDLMSGECDILPPGEDYGRDVKTAWSLATFPCVREDAHNPLYEWQVRGYMHIYNRDRWFVDYCMVDTPEDLRKYEQAELHEVEHINPRLRVTTVMYERDLAIEAKMLEKCRHAQKYIEEIKARILIEHDAE